MKRPIRVLLIAPSFQILGGQSVQASRLMNQLSHVEGLEMGFQPITTDIGVLRRIPYLRTVLSIGLYWLSLLRRVWRYDILHVFSASYWSYNLWTLPALLMAKLLGKKIILNYRDGQAADHMTNWPLALPTVRMMDRVVTPSKYLVDVFAGFNIQARSIVNVIDRDKFIFRERKQLKPVFLHNRILEPLYDIRTALQAFQIVQREYPEADLTVAHDGPLRGELEAYAAEIGLKHYRFVGRVPHEEIATLYDQVDLYITSPVYDCMPGSLLECFSSGLPVVATNAGGIPYIAENERTALLVECGDFEAMAKACLRLLREPELVIRLTQAAREEVLRYAERPVRDQWVEMYKEVIPG